MSFWLLAKVWNGERGEKRVGVDESRRDCSLSDSRDFRVVSLDARERRFSAERSICQLFDGFSSDGASNRNLPTEQNFPPALTLSVLQRSSRVCETV